MPDRPDDFDLYRRMLLIRHFEERVDELYRAARMPGLAHLYIGQEAVAVGVCAASAASASAMRICGSP